MNVMFACFYDNRIGNGYESYLCPQVIFYKVRDTCRFERIDPEIKNAYDIVFDAILNVNPNNSLPGCAFARMYAAFIKNVAGRYEFDPLAGDILQMSGQDFIMHVEKACQMPYVSAFIFDWDRTLQKTELMLGHLTIDDIMATLNVPQACRAYFIQGVAIYHAGGANRYLRIVNMFRQMTRRRVYIYTSNPAVQTASLDIYQAILEDWGCPQAVIQYSFNKYRDMSQDPFLSSL